jgi:hypothetical protein
MLTQNKEGISGALSDENELCKKEYSIKEVVK